MTDYRSERLRDIHDVQDFDCGVPSLNDWLAHQATRAQSSNTARTYVWTAGHSVQVAAYYAVTPTEVRRADLSGSMAGGVSVVPGYLLARLALDRPLHGSGLGSWLLYDALEVIVQAAELAGGRIVVVDAIDDNAASFYGRHGFQKVKHNPHRLVMKMATCRTILEQTAPKPN